uniref:Uncharacterized protein n=1 Tax=Rhizophora mucronata TaxID=61149 RepID=A0A2P2NKL1_RHIMU
MCLRGFTEHCVFSGFEIKTENSFKFLFMILQKLKKV